VLTKPVVIALTGSLRPVSRTAAAARTALEGAAQAGAETALLDLREYALPIFDARDDDDYPEDVWRFVEAVGQADGLILASPVYHGTLSGALKNAIDFLHLLPRGSLEGKTAGLIAVAGGSQGINTINTLDYIAKTLHLWTVPTTVSAGSSAFDAQGQLHDPRLIARLHDLGQQVASFAGALGNTALERAASV
jgi:NAD(P)H-dependent FMN reductase